MKPDWKDAPYWANWLAMDEYGLWCWYESKPIRAKRMWIEVGGRTEDAVLHGWQESLEESP